MHAPGNTRRWLVDEAGEERLASAARSVFQDEPSVVAVYLYGSAARRQRAVDLDLAVLLDAPFDSARLERFASELQAVGAPSGPPIDLRPLSGAAPRYQAAVIKEGRVLFERDRNTRLQHEAMIMSRWADFKPTWDSMRRRMLERWRHG